MNSTSLNPFTVKEFELTSKFYYTSATPAYFVQLYVLSAIQALLFFLNLVSLVVRFKRKNSWWLFKLRAAQLGRSRFIVPSSTICFLIFHSIFLGLIQGYIYNMRSFAKPGSNVAGTIFWKTLAFVPLWTGGWIMAWSTLISPIFVRQTDYSSSFFDPSRHPLLINIFFVSAPILFITSFITLPFVTSRTMDKSYVVYNITRSALIVAAHQFDQGVSPDLVTLAALKNQLESLRTLMTSQWRTTWILGSAFNCTFILVFSIAVVIQIRALNTGIRKHRFKSVQVNSISGSALALEDHTFKWAYRGIIFTSIATIIWGSAYTVVGCILAAEASSIVDVALISVTIEFVVLYFAAIVGGIISITLFYRSFTSSTFSSTTSNSINVPRASDGIPQFTFNQQTTSSVTSHSAEDRFEPRAYELNLVEKNGPWVVNSTTLEELEGRRDEKC